MEDDEDADALDYVLDGVDHGLLHQVMGALHHCFHSAETSWAQKASLAKLLHAFSRLPSRSSSAEVEITIYSPRYHFEPEELFFYLSVGVSDSQLTIRFSGHYHHPSTGGDSFSVFSWSAVPGEAPERRSYVASLGVVTALIDPMWALRELTSSQSTGDLEVVDHDNDLLDDEPIEDEPAEEEHDEAPVDAGADDGDSVTDEDGDEPVESSRAVSVVPVTAADRSLLAQLNPQQLRKTSGGEAYGIEACDRCRLDLSTVGLFVDGHAAGGAWGNYCAACSLALALTLGWGKGQLYARQPDGTWHGIAGFRS